MNETNIYIPALLKFGDDKISIPELVQKTINKSITIPFIKEIDEDGFDYTLDSLSLHTKIKGVFKEISKLEIKIYYYHHRIIFKYKVTTNSPLKTKLPSSVRKMLNDHFKVNIELLINQINTGVLASTFKPKEDQNACKVIMYYSYPIIFQKYDEDTMNKLSYKLETMYFRVYFPNNEKESYGTKAYIRISIPSFYVFYNDELDNELISNIINAIYQTVLYNKKITDLKFITPEVEIQKIEKTDDR